MARARDIQPGLEVVERYTAPEVVPNEYNRGYGDGLEVLLAQVGDKKEDDTPEPTHWNKSRRRLIIIAVAASLVVIGAAIGGVLGGLASRDHNNNTGETPTSPAPTATATATLQSLRPNSKLAVAGWRASGGLGFKIRLFYQDRNDTLRFSEFSSDGGGWSASNKVSSSQVLPGTSIGASASVWDNPDGTTPLGGSSDSVNDYPVAAYDRSIVALYWPYAVIQDVGGNLRLVTYQSPGAYFNNSIGLSGMESTGMAVIPRSAKYKTPWTAELIYQMPNGRLEGYTLRWNTSGQGWDIGVDNAIPQRTAIAAFSVAKDNSGSGDDIIAYVVYQSATNDIELLINDGSTWNSSTVALGGADAGTDIACLTESLWGGDNVLSSRYDMSRCYFLSSGQIREVLYNGTGWEELGNIPLS
ncbi:uncharacterized protein F4822DRAFT_443340 [Hypoxylon trugodes]|uniref:uncharacterized protein n=1 Tax=Hypoxylon trugodes TaxID=326681 RepID=UPI002191D33D|nr:uncharacterized protein F4822DRAFT_443340 [Hypoxylon trugodes]KAI1388184.1 hypothetical protein F4822DRAFT_443340 [Hypoxylon trugodes]